MYRAVLPKAARQALAGAAEREARPASQHPVREHIHSIFALSQRAQAQ